MDCEKKVPDNSDECRACMARESLAVTRRSFFASFLGMSAAMIAAVIGAPLFRFVLYPVQNSTRKVDWAEVGDASEFEHIDTPVVKSIALTQRDGWRDVVSVQPVYVSRSRDGMLQVLSPICPHLGCSVAWHASQNKFVCPCHGGQFGGDGSHISGPPPRGLDRLDAQVKNGKLQVQFAYFRSNVPKREVMS
jgi:menaquinol-cytochrome c reductase iron-sulfur subunit